MLREGEKRGAWVPSSPENPSTTQWLQVDLGSVNTVTSVATQGRSDFQGYVTKYKLLYSQNGNDFLYYRETGQTEDKVISLNTI